MPKRSSRILISATSSNVGKTLFVSALLEVLKFSNTHSFKCGPDYIDPMYHEAVLGITSKNLDPFFMDENLMKASFLEDAGDINIIEGCMGLYDGLGVTSKCSTYEVAQNLRTPVVLLVDAAKAGYSIVAAIKGYQSLDTDNLIKGVILNRISEGYYKKLSKVIEEECGIKTLGYMPVIKESTFESRHLGLKSVEENNAKEIVHLVSLIIKDTVDIDGILDVAESAEHLVYDKKLADYVSCNATEEKPLIAVAKDEAFNFLYKDNLWALAMCGADIVYFSPLWDEKLPENVKGVVIPGGYPELYAKQLSDNKSMLESIRAAAEKGMPVIAECGGYMYLQRAIEIENKAFGMVGIFDGIAKNKGKLVRFGYIEATNEAYKIKGHEFHHFDVDNPGEDFDIVKASDRNIKYKAVESYKNVTAGFPHLFYLSDTRFIADFIDKAINYDK